MKILLRNLSRNTTEAELLELLSNYGKVQYCKVVMDKVTGISKGFGFAEMPRAGEAKAAIKGLNGQHVGENPIRVKRTESNKKLSSEKDSQAKPGKSAWPNKRKNN